MFAFVLYAGLVWYAAVRWRRTWLGFALVFAGLAGVGLVAFAHYKLNKWTNGYINLPVLQVLLYPYGALILVIGLFIAALPRVYQGTQCRRCGYELHGLETRVRTCPECGTVHAMDHLRGESCATCENAMGSDDGDKCVCPDCRTVHVLKPVRYEAPDAAPDRRAA